MTRITVIGGTGYAGTNIAQQAIDRGHEVTVVARSVPANPIAGVNYQTGNVNDPQVLESAVRGSELVISALSPRVELEGAGKLAGIIRTLAAAAQKANVRLGVVGGAGSLLVAPGGPTVAETEDFPDAFKAEAAEMATVLANLRSSGNGLDWFYVSPAGSFGAWAPGEHTGTFRVGNDLLLTDENGNSEISGADFGQAVVEEIEQNAHLRKRFTVAY